MSASLATLIDVEYTALRTCVLNKQRAARLNNIIQLKKMAGLNNKNDVFIDIKQYIKYYILSSEEHTFGYDEVVFEKIEEKIFVQDLSARYSLYKYASKLLKTNGNDEQYETCEKQVTVLKKQILLRKKTLPNLIHWFYIFTTETKGAIALSLGSCLFIASVILLPAFDKKFEFIHFDTVEYTNTYWLNRVLNTLSIMLGLDDSVKARPINMVGFAIVAAGKIFFLLIVSNILVKQFISKTNLD